MDLVTVRIPDLTAHPGPLSLDDRIPIWYAALDKTRRTSLSTLRDFILTGGDGASLPVVQNGDTIIHIVTAGEAGGSIVSLPALAGKTFKLRRAGMPLLAQSGSTPTATDEYVCLSAGGFELLQPGDVLIEGERFELEVFSLQGGSSSTPGSGGGSLVNGQVIVTTNITLNAVDHVNKLISIRSDTNIITVTLPDVLDVPDNTIMPIETTILNNFQTRITTQGGQFIYMRNANYTSLYMGKSESLWLYRADDGWYVINDFANNYAQVGKIQASYKVGINELLADGTLYSRAAHPRLWGEIQTFGSSLVSDATWSTASVSHAGRTVEWPYSGCFSTGDGSTTFRVPDLRNRALRGLRNIGSSDDQRYHNHAGGYQRHEFELHNHVSAPFDKAAAKASDVDSTNTPGGVDSSNNTTEYRVANMGAYWGAATIQGAGGNESRMDNVGVLWTIKE
jgi:microcystin-dependent protein